MASNANWLNTIWQLLLGVAGIYVIVGLLLFIFQSSLLYFPNTPSRKIVATPKSIGLGYEPVTIETDDGFSLDGWFIPAKDARGVLLFFHGNAGNMSHRLESLKIFNGLRLSTLIFDYRGYGRSDGKPSEQGTYRDAVAAWRYLTEQRQIAKENIVFFGRSLGGAVAAHLAGRHCPGALILESVFTSVPDLASHLYPIFPVRWLSRFRYDAKSALKSVACPVLVIHSPHDEIVPFRHGRALFDAANAPKQFLELRGGHNDGFLLSGQKYLDGIDGFLNTHIGN
jgi:fermentation-respiration switch protein FrsA (DUF1100 family)